MLRMAFARGGLKLWIVRLSASVLLWTCLVQFTPHLPQKCPPCFASLNPFPDFNESARVNPTVFLTPKQMYKSNGYLKVSCNGGLNQMRAAICDMVTIAKVLNLTLVVPELDKTSFWADSSEFEDIFDVKHFITSLQDDVRIVTELPQRLHRRSQRELFSIPPVSWSSERYYLKKILPLIRKHKVVHFNKTDARLANNGLPLEIQKFRCYVNYNALRFNPHIEKMGQKLVNTLQRNGFFLVVHLRYEMDMLAFSGCAHGCAKEEEDALTRMRYAYPWWKEKEIISEKKRSEGLCPLTPEETTLVLKALGYQNNTQIYIASGKIYNSERRMAPLHAAYSNIVSKETLLSPTELQTFQNHSSQMAALDYLVSIASNVFIPTYNGNMAKLVEGHRRYLGFQTTVSLDRRRLVPLIDMYQNGSLPWEQFAESVRQIHKKRIGTPGQRETIPNKPKEEEYFYANPQECLVDILPNPSLVPELLF